jgi:hypothetical protein
MRWIPQHVKSLTDLALDLFASPSSGVACASTEVCVCTSLPCHDRKEVMTEVISDLALGKGIRQITKKKVSYGIR